MSFKELVKLMEKGEAPNKIMHKGIIYNYVGADSTKEERLEDIKANGLWNNGGYYSNNNDFLLDNLEPNDYNNSEIMVLESQAKEDKVDELRDKLERAKRYIKENSIKIGKFNVIIEENDELKYILEEKVEI